MGEEVSNLWNLWEQKKFESLVKTNPVSTGKSFLKPAFKCLPSQCRETIVNYYFNVYLPRRMSTLTRSGCEIVDTDDEASEDAPCTKEVNLVNSGGKTVQAALQLTRFRQIVRKLGRNLTLLVQFG
ncbi:hypothetical protein RJ640_015294, partial [Escallonia rubra]